MEDTDNLKIESYQQQFKEKGYAVIEGFVPPGVAALIANYARIRVAIKTWILWMMVLLILP